METLKKADLFRKPKQELEKETVCGAFLSILTISFIASLSVLHIPDTLSHEFSKNIYVKSSSDQPFTVNFDITFVHSPCDILRIEKKDILSHTTMNVRSGIAFERLTFDRNDLVWNEYIDPEIKRLYPNEDRKVQKILTGLRQNEKCRISGSFVASKTPGRINFFQDFELSVKVSAASPELYRKANLAHYITEFTFGSKEVQEIVKLKFQNKVDTDFNSANGIAFVSSQTFICNYYLKVLQYDYPVFEEDYLSGQVYKYSLHHQCTVLKNYKPGAKAGLTFTYETTPFSVVYSESGDVSILTVLQTVLSIVCGVTVIMRILQRSCIKLLRFTPIED